MDPNETLRELRALVAAFREHDRYDSQLDAADALVERFEALDSWLSQGGFPPEAWREGPDVPAERIYVPAPERDGARVYRCAVHPEHYETTDPVAYEAHMGMRHAPRV